MNLILTIIVFFLIFSVLILIHEFGHFYMAKKAGIKVEEFGFGLPPRLWGKKKGETIYSVNWIPFGGFVRMYGEDSTDAKMKRSKRSFAGQSARARIAVVVAGVVMNFFLAWFLMTIALSFGVRVFVGPSDVLPSVENGTIVLQPGLKIESLEGQNSGFEEGDLIVSFDGDNFDDFDYRTINNNPAGLYEVWRDGEIVNVNVEEGVMVEDLGWEFANYGSFPRVKVFELVQPASAYQAGLREGDVIIRVNGYEIFNVEEFEELIRGVTTLEYEVYRDGRVQEFIVERDQSRQVIVSKVIPDSVADNAGIEDGDVILSVNGNIVDDSEELISFTTQNTDQTLAYMVSRDGQRLLFEIQPEEGRIGVFLSELMSYIDNQGMTLYNVDLLSSMVEHKKTQYGPLRAAGEALGETYKLSKYTARMFVSFVGQLVSERQIAQDVAGPVGIAQMTSVVVQEGVIPVLYFAAVLSLSLAVINILPFPALDGGRLLFILIEIVIGRPVSQKWESWIHGIGYILLLGLILAVTFNDVLRLITG